MVEYRLITVIPVNPFKWKRPNVGHPKNDEGWMRFMWHEIALNWSWFPPGSYGKLCIEMKRPPRSVEEGKVEVVLAWQKALRDKGRIEKINIIEGSEISETKHYRWELYESDYFKLPEWDKPVLVWLYGRHEDHVKLSVAMWSLAVFEVVQ